MTAKKRVLIGAIGGITPFIATLLTVNYQDALGHFQFGDGLGLCIRGLVYIFLGGLFAYLHHSEIEPFKVFQFGVAAPALLATAVNGYNQNVPSSPKEIVPPTAIHGAFFGPNYAFADEETPPVAKVSEFKNNPYLREPEISAKDRFLRGLFGKKISNDDNSWFVIVGSHPDRGDAFRQVEELKDRGYDGKVYLPYSGSKYYGVAIGSNISKTEAMNLQEKAVDDGLPKDTYLWSR